MRRLRRLWHSWFPTPEQKAARAAIERVAQRNAIRAEIREIVREELAKCLDGAELRFGE